MALVDVLLSLVVVSGGLLFVATALLVGRERLTATVDGAGRRFGDVWPSLVLLLVVLGLNRVARRVGQEVSWIVGWNVTGYIFELEGEFVATVQSIATPALTAYFSAVYVYGYVFLLVFPLVAYFALERTEPFRTAVVAYSLNYLIGVVCYVLFVSYGPRNVMPELVEGLLFTTYPNSQLLTSQVNVNTNVFPSLHTSLSATVALLAVTSHDRYPRWTPIAVALATSVVVSTMYLGIHWATDVVGGLALAGTSVWLADRVVRDERSTVALLEDAIASARTRLR